MVSEQMLISQDEYTQLKKKEKIADDILLQMDSSLRDLEAGRTKRVR